MKKESAMRIERVVVTLLGSLMLIAVPTLAQQASTQQTAQPLQAPLSNKDVLDMQSAGLGADIIIAKIKSFSCNFDMSSSALKELKTANVPNGVILAMVQAPAANGSTTGNNQQTLESKKAASEHARGYLGMSLANAKPPAHGASVLKVSSAGPAAHAGIREGDLVEAVDGQPIVDVKDYIEKMPGPGTQLTLKILRDKQESEVSATTVPASPELITVVKAVAYKSLPYYSTSVYQISPGSSRTTCNGTTYGNIAATAQPDYSGGANISGTVNSDTTTNCDTTYQPPQQGQITWRTVYNYSVVEGGSYRFVILCTASVRWSKCAHLIPGDEFPVEVEGNHMWVTGLKNGNQKKPERVKYDILQVAPIQ